MPAYVALLRGVNVGGANKVPMAQLRTLFDSLGFADVSTFIQSGNVIFSNSKAVTPARLEKAIAGEFGVNCRVVLRTPRDLARILGANPFPKADLSKLHVGFFVEKPTRAAVAKLETDDFHPEEVVVRGGEVYFHLPNGMGRTKLPGYVDRRLKVPMTIRTWKTVTKLLELWS